MNSQPTPIFYDHKNKCREIAEAIHDCIEKIFD